MAQIPLNIQNIIDRYLDELKRNKINIQQAYLFGSYAKGYQNEYSDIDIALISDQFTGNRFLDREKIRSISVNVSSLLEIIPFNTDDFNIKDPFAKEIINSGLRIL